MAALTFLCGQAQAQFKHTTTNGTITITGYTGIGGAVTIPSSFLLGGVNVPVTSIGTNAFMGSKLTSVVIPDSVTTIGASAFALCGNLTNVSIGNGVTSIGASAFFDSGSINAVTLGSNVSTIGDSAFAFISQVNLYFAGNIPAVGQNVFQNSVATAYYVAGTPGWNATFDGLPTGLWSPDIQCAYTVTNNEVTITNYMGSGGSIAIPAQLAVNGVNLPITTIGDGAYEYANLTSVTIASGIATIGSNAFREFPVGPNTLASVTLGNGVVTIGDRSFENCFYLANITIPDSTTSIGNQAFYECNLLASATIGKNVTSIGDGAFYFTRLSNLTLPYGVTTIGANAFANTNLTSLTIPNSVTSIGDGAFGYCYNLTQITLSNNLSSIAGNLFSGCNLSTIAIPNSVTSIGDSAFQNCGLTSIIIPNSVTSMGNSTFYACPFLTSVTMAAGVISIGSQAFVNCPKLTVIYVDVNNPAYSSVDGVLFDKQQTTLVSYPGGLTGNYVIPNSVHTLADTAFNSAYKLTGLVVPNGVTTIPAEEFQSCTNVTSITLGSHVISIGDNAFDSCNNLAGVYFTGNAPAIGDTLFIFDLNPDINPNLIQTVYYLPGATGWTSTFSGVPTALLNSPFILTPPTGASVVAGANATFTFTASGLPAPTFQWQVSTDGGNTWANLTNSNGYNGSTTSSLTLNASSATQLGYQYQAVLTNANGTIATAPVALVVGTSNAKLAWLESIFSSAQLGQPAIVGDLAAPANDGIPNFLKYAFNLNPFVNGQSSLPQPALNNHQLMLTVPSPQTDLAYTIQASTDLANWSTTGVTQSNGPPLTASYNLSGSAPAFLRIVVAPAP